jgi:hypothetical protein
VIGGIKTALPLLVAMSAHEPDVAEASALVAKVLARINDSDLAKRKEARAMRGALP